MFSLSRMNRFPALFALLLALLGAAPAWAQSVSAGRGAGRPRMERLENARIAYITDKISLTPEQAQRFWPLFNEFTAKRRDLRRQTKVGLRNQDFSAMSDKDIRTALDEQFKLRQSEINLEKEYVEKFQKVISLRQVAQLLQAERDFTKELIQRLDNGRADGPPRGQD
jgi:Spy/CpxP family protein refolding chaperone